MRPVRNAAKPPAKRQRASATARSLAAPLLLASHEPLVFSCTACNTAFIEFLQPAPTRMSSGGPHMPSVKVRP